MSLRNQNENSEGLPEKQVTRRSFSLRLAALFSGLGLAKTAIFSPETANAGALPAAEEISRSAEAIHQEVNFDASPTQVYKVLTDAKLFSQVVKYSAAMRSGAITDTPTEISGELGGTFSAFGGYVTGRQLELVPGQRVVQAWRAGSWPPGAYSIARFELAPQGTGTKLVFEHGGFPQGQAEHLLAGWKGNYWEPIAKVLAETK
ncbi:MAG: SRPBCC domain-containing protein [Candidatus Acidiferrum sp.]